MAVPLAVLVACELRRRRPAPHHHHPPAGSLGAHVVEFAALVVPSLTILFDAVNAVVLLGALLAAATLLLAPQVREPPESRGMRRAPGVVGTETVGGTRGCCCVAAPQAEVSQPRAYIPQAAKLIERCERRWRRPRS